MSQIIDKEEFYSFVLIRDHSLDGEQIIVLFPNGYGASIVKSLFSYGGKYNLWELAVIEGSLKDGVPIFDLTYATPITHNVIGWISLPEAMDILEKIFNLPLRIEDG
jgi:hypothetical protein